MKIEQHQFTGKQVDDFYRWYDSGIRDGNIRIVHASLNGEDGMQRYTLVENNNTAVTIDRTVPKQDQPEAIGFARIEL